MAKVGRKTKITASKYIDAVIKRRSLNDKDVSDVLGVDLTTVYRYRLKNPDIFSNAEKQLKEVKIIRYDGKNTSREVFLLNPSIVAWVDMQKKRRVGKKTIRGRTNVLYNVCTHLGVSPDKLTVENASKLVHEMRERYDAGEEQIRGLSYYTIRKPLRIWFMLKKGISGELLTNKGIDAGRSKGTGSMATERMTIEQRKRHWDNIPIAVMRYCEDETESIQNIVEEIRAISIFMYYTATRITATRNIVFNDAKSSYEENTWKIHIIDKGKRGGIEWIKLLHGHGLEKMREYVTKRFGITKDLQDEVLPNTDKKMFPWIHENYRKECKIMKHSLKLSGCKTRIPNHVWRHTFAQDWLDASDWNYELGAAIGGWKDTGTMKLSYGKINRTAIERGLRKAMGEKVKDVTYLLRY